MIRLSRVCGGWKDIAKQFGLSSFKRHNCVCVTGRFMLILKSSQNSDDTMYSIVWLVIQYVEYNMIGYTVCTVQYDWLYSMYSTIWLVIQYVSYKSLLHI